MYATIIYKYKHTHTSYAIIIISKNLYMLIQVISLTYVPVFSANLLVLGDIKVVFHILFDKNVLIILLPSYFLTVPLKALPILLSAPFFTFSTFCFRKFLPFSFAHLSSPSPYSSALLSPPLQLISLTGSAHNLLSVKGTTLISLRKETKICHLRRIGAINGI